MSSSFKFTFSQSSDEKHLKAVRFLKKEIEESALVIDSVDITAFDEDGVEVTDTILDTNYSSFSANKALFMTNYPAAGTYIIKVKAMMSDGSEPSAWGLLISADPAV